MKWISFFLIELGLCMALVAAGYHYEVEVAARLGFILPFGAAVLVFLVDGDSIFSSPYARRPRFSEEVLMGLFCGGIVGVYGAPICLVLTGTYVTAAFLFLGGIAAFAVMLAFGVLGEYLKERLMRMKKRKAQTV